MLSSALQLSESKQINFIHMMNNSLQEKKKKATWITVHVGLFPKCHEMALCALGLQNCQNTLKYVTEND